MARVRRLRKEVAHLEVTAFINLIVVLVPFLLSTAVFSRLAVLELNLPAPSNSGVEQLKVEDLKLEVVIRPASLDVSDRVGGLIQSIPATPAGHDTAALNALLQQVKAKFPDKDSATILAQPDTPYELLVQVMDAVREVPPPSHGKAPRVQLFPVISIGDAPPPKPEKKA